MSRLFGAVVFCFCWGVVNDKFSAAAAFFSKVQAIGERKFTAVLGSDSLS
jgi:hypothetical protein